jgi:hypothetical protein
MTLILKFLGACVLLYWAVCLGRLLINIAAIVLVFIAGAIGFVLTAIFSRKDAK